MSGVELLGYAGTVYTAAIFIIDTFSKIKDLPDSIRQRSAHLEQLRNLVKEIEENPALQTESIKPVLQSCLQHMEKLQTVVEEISTSSDDGRIQKTWKTIQSLRKEEEIHHIFAELENSKSTLGLYINAINTRQSSNILQETSRIRTLTTETLKYYGELTNTPSWTEKQWEEACVALLFTTNPVDDRSALITVKGRRAQGTCEWIKNNDLYQAWLESPSGHLWITGGPGKGKTMLSIFLTQELEQYTTTKEENVIYYFCDNRDAKRNTAQAILRTLIYQLLDLSQVLFKYILPELKIQRKALFSSFEALWRIFEAMLRDPATAQVYCVLDGLDECEEESLKLLAEKLSELSKPPDSRIPSFKLVVVSRDTPLPISRAMSGCSRLKLDPDFNDLVNNDVQNYIEQGVDKLTRLHHYSDDLRDTVKKTLCERSKGTFLWVSFVIHELDDTPRGDVQRVLDSLPLGLDNMYARMLAQIRTAHRKTTASILQWVTMAFRPLKLQELGEAVGIKFSHYHGYNETVSEHVKLCGQILVIADDVVDLVHQSAKDYLLRQERDKDPVLESYRIRSKEADATIADTCILYLQKGGFNHELNPFWPYRREMLQKFPMLRYAAIYCMQHASRSSYSLRYLSFFQSKSRCLDNWLSYYSEYWCLARWSWKGLPHDMPIFHRVCLLGIESIVYRLLHRRTHRLSHVLFKYVNKKDSDGSRPLHWAVLFGQESIVRLLLQHKAGVNKTDDLGRTPLIWASLNRSSKMVQLLLDPNHSAKVNIIDKGGQTALMHAAVNSESVKLLLNHGAEANGSDDDGWTALMHAAVDSESVKLLLNHGAEANGSDDDGWTALMHAARNPESVRLLLNHGAEANGSDDDGTTALIEAARSPESVRLLLDHGAEVNTANRYGITALMRAAENPESVRLLLDHGAEVNARDEEGTTALLCAARNPESVRLLLNHGAEANGSDDDGTTALMQAAREGLSDSVELLLDREAEVDARDDNGNTALMVTLIVLAKGPRYFFSGAARMKQFEKIVELLLDHGAEANVTNKEGKTALSIMDGKDVRIVGLLLAYGATMKDGIEERLDAEET